jgi:Winged helix-turn helix
VSFTLHLSPFTRKQLYRHLQQAYARGALRVVKRIHVLLALAEEMSVQEVAEMSGLGAQTVRDYRNRFLLRRMASLTYKRPPGRPRKLTKAQRRVAYPLPADNVSRPLPSRLRRLTQPVMSPPHGFSAPRPPLLICI